jgi:hypothetical protein
LIVTGGYSPACGGLLSQITACLAGSHYPVQSGTKATLMPIEKNEHNALK